MAPANFDRDIRLRFLRIDDQVCQSLGVIWQMLEPHLDGLLDDFYRHLQTVPALADLVGTPDNIERLKRAQRTHWERLFAGKFDSDYFSAVVRVGQAHERIGLEPRWYIGGYSLVMSALGEIMGTHHRKDGRAAARDFAVATKAILLDMELATTVYYDAVKQTAADTLNRHADAFESNVLQVLDLVGASAGDLDGTAKRMSGSADQAARQAGIVAAASEEASVAVQTVASAAEQLSRSINEISSQVSESTRIAQAAVDEAQQTDQTINGLADSSEKIGNVVGLIKDIADQTNLLALNATIEAARAGDAGRGFAVVASEVKALATQTGSATEEIASQIGQMHSAVEGSVKAIQRIGQTIGRLNEIATTIAAAVEQQNAATGEISRNTQEASGGTQEVSTNIVGVSDTAKEVGNTAAALETAAGELNQRYEQLRERVSGFLTQIRAA